MRLFPVIEGVQFIAYCAYITAVVVMTYSLLLVVHPWGDFFYLFPFLLILALFTSNHTAKHLLAVSSLVLVLSSGVVQTIPLANIRDTLLFLPMCYVVLFPGTLWPIVIGATLVNGYMYQLSIAEFEAFIDVSFRMTGITIFSTALTYYYMRTHRQVETFKSESLTDYLTKLPNLNAYNQALNDVTNQNASRYGLIHIGLDGFKNVNDRLGYRHGDILLTSFANYLKELIAKQGRLFRLGGDEFVVLVESKNDVVHKLEGIIDTLTTTKKVMFDVDNTSHRLAYCMGVALASDASGNNELWAKNADFALYKARSQGAGAVCWFDDVLLGETIRQHQIESEIKEALEQQQFVLMFQPKASVQTGIISGAEALLRWNHPQLGPIAPIEFVPIAEKTTQIVPIGHWIIHEACRQAKQCSDEGLDICIAVNVSTVQFEHTDLFEVVRAALRETGLAAHLLQLEITESTLMNDPENTIEICRQLRAIGVSIAIDDFGVEYSSMKYLKQLPVDVIKIDKCFIDEISVSASDRILVRTMIHMGHSLGLHVVAEGVEHEEQLTVLHEEACDQYQGYLFSQPIPYNELTSMLRQESELKVEA